MSAEVVIGALRFNLLAQSVFLFKLHLRPVLNGHSKIDKTKVFKTDGSLVQLVSIAEYSLH